MIKLDFSAINESSKKSFNEQKSMIKKIGKGKTVLCPHCQQPLQLVVSSENESGINCVQGCTQINLEVEGK